LYVNFIRLHYDFGCYIARIRASKFHLISRSYKTITSHLVDASDSLATILRLMNSDHTNPDGLAMEEIGLR